MKRSTRSLVAIACAAAWCVLLGASKPPASDSIPPKHVYSIEDSPGYVPAFDPESASVVAGRRLNAPVVSKRFVGGAKSLEALGRSVCWALHHSRRDSLMSLCIREDEFRDILWPEFPQSRPATGLTWEDGWRTLLIRLNSGCSEAVRDYGDHHYDFIRFDIDSVMTYKNFKVYSRIRLVAKDDEGQVQRMKWVRAIVERKGSFKIMATDD